MGLGALGACPLIGRSIGRSTRGGLAPGDDELHASDVVGGIAVESGDVARGESLQFAAPAGVGDFDAENTVGEIECMGARRYGAAAGEWPGQQWRLLWRSLSQSTGDNFVEAGRGRLHGDFGLRHD